MRCGTSGSPAAGAAGNRSAERSPRVPPCARGRRVGSTCSRKGADNAMWHKWFDGTWRNWESLGGLIDNEPGAVSWSPGRIDVFARGMDNALWHRWFDGRVARLGVARWHDHRRPRERARGRPRASTCSRRVPTTRCGTSGSTTADGAAGNRSAASSITRRPPCRGACRASTASPAAWITRCGTSGGRSGVRPCGCT